MIVKSKFKLVQDIIFFTAVGLFFTALFLSIALFFLPYYVGREVWGRYEIWYINRGEK